MRNMYWSIKLVLVRVTFEIYDLQFHVLSTVF